MTRLAVAGRKVISGLAFYEVNLNACPNNHQWAILGPILDRGLPPDVKQLKMPSHTITVLDEVDGVSISTLSGHLRVVSTKQVPEDIVITSEDVENYQICRFMSQPIAIETFVLGLFYPFVGPVYSFGEGAEGCVIEVGSANKLRHGWFIYTPKPDMEIIYYVDAHEVVRVK